MSEEGIFDAAIIGGGINGAGIARDAAGRGLSVLLCEKGDLAEGTSSASTKLIHGGLRYLEFLQFGLVKEALHERETLLRLAPHLVWPMGFVLPVEASVRSGTKIELGLMLYDWFARGGSLPRSRMVNLQKLPEGQWLETHPKDGFIYYDCATRDARLVIVNAMDARDKGADIRPRTEVLEARREEDHWRLRLRGVSGEIEERARVVVNAAGPWAAKLLESGVVDGLTRHSLRLVKGSHIVLPRLFDHDKAYLFQLEDRRVVFAIPFEEDFTLIGTTEEGFDGNPGHAQISMAEADYLCAAVRRFFGKHCTPVDTVWSFAGVRPIYDTKSADMRSASRDSEVRVEKGRNLPPLVNVFGGKLTSYRAVAEDVTDRLCALLARDAAAWTASAPLPGGDIPFATLKDYRDAMQHRHDWLPPKLVWHYVTHYGTKTEELLDGIRTITALGRHFGGNLYEAEVDYLRHAEWAQTPDDILWRRTKEGLRVPPEGQARLAEWMGVQTQLPKLALEKF